MNIKDYLTNSELRAVGIEYACKNRKHAIEGLYNTFFEKLNEKFKEINISKNDDIWYGIDKTNYTINDVNCSDEQLAEIANKIILQDDIENMPKEHHLYYHNCIKYLSNCESTFSERAIALFGELKILKRAYSLTKKYAGESKSLYSIIENKYNKDDFKVSFYTYKDEYICEIVKKEKLGNYTIIDTESGVKKYHVSGRNILEHFGTVEDRCSGIFHRPDTPTYYTPLYDKLKYNDEIIKASDDFIEEVRNSYNDFVQGLL